VNIVVGAITSIGLLRMGLKKMVVVLSRLKKGGCGSVKNEEKGGDTVKIEERGGGTVNNEARN